MTRLMMFTSLLLSFSFTALADSAWTQKADFGGAARMGAVGFSIGDKGYVGTGSHDGKEFWEYDPQTDTWTQKADFGGTPRVNAVGFSIGGYGYVGTGFDSSGKRRDFWLYNQELNIWIRKADFGGSARDQAVGFSIGDKGYIATGADSTGRRNDFWEYNPMTDTWTQKTDFGGTEREGAVGFSIGNKGYIGTGFDGQRRNDFWEYDTVTNTWTQRADAGGIGRVDAVGFSVGNKGYIGTGRGGPVGGRQKDFWEYNTQTNIWEQKEEYGDRSCSGAIGFSIGNKGYLGTGSTDISRSRAFWEYNPGNDTQNPPDQVLLSYPSDEENVEVSGDEPEVQLGWYPSQPAVTNYQLMVAEDEEFTEILLDEEGITDTFYVFTGIDVENEHQSYFWRVRAENETDWGPYSETWSFAVTVVGDGDGGEIPEVYSLMQNYPNPFNPSTVIRYGLPERSSVHLEIFNTLGQRVATLVDAEQDAGYHEVTFDASRFASGVYIYKLTAGEFVESKKLLFLK